MSGKPEQTRAEAEAAERRRKEDEARTRAGGL